MTKSKGSAKKSSPNKGLRKAGISAAIGFGLAGAVAPEVKAQMLIDMTGVADTGMNVTGGGAAVDSVAGNFQLKSTAGTGFVVDAGTGLLTISKGGIKTTAGEFNVEAVGASEIGGNDNIKID